MKGPNVRKSNFASNGACTKVRAIWQKRTSCEDHIALWTEMRWQNAEMPRICDVTSMIPCMHMDLAINATHLEQTLRLQFYKRPTAKGKKKKNPTTNKQNNSSSARQKMDKLTNYCRKTTMVNRTTTDTNERPGVVATLITVENRRENIN